MNETNARQPMTMGRARDLTAACVRHRVSLQMGEDPERLPDVSLEELLEANRLVAETPKITNEDGSKTLLVHCNPRGIAASFVFERYGRCLRGVLGAVGYEGLVFALEDEQVAASLKAYAERMGA